MTTLCEGLSVLSVKLIFRLCLRYGYLDLLGRFGFQEQLEYLVQFPQGQIVGSFDLQGIGLGNAHVHSLVGLLDCQLELRFAVELAWPEAGG